MMTSSPFTFTCPVNFRPEIVVLDELIFIPADDVSEDSDIPAPAKPTFVALTCCPCVIAPDETADGTARDNRLANLLMLVIVTGLISSNQGYVRP